MSLLAKQLVTIMIISLSQLSLVSATSNENIETLYDNSSLIDLFNVETDAKANVGSRGKAVNLLKAKSPVDIITAEQINSTGYTELSQVLQRFIAGFNFPRPSIKDGTDHIRPFTLRGMSSDQVLVLVNGKRLHTSSLLHVNGTIGRGSTGVDLNTIPLRSIERVEVLRDGASAQYGSDAIAGIINIILKSGGEERRLSSTMGQTYKGDGELYQVDMHYGLSLPRDGFIDMTAELRDRNPTNRAIIDTRQQYFDGDSKNDQVATQKNRRGDPDTQNFLFALNSELPLSDAIILYLHSSVNYREGEAGAFFRRPLDNRNVRDIYPDGFLPLIAPNIVDYSATMGAKGETDFNLHWDLTHTMGRNSIDYDVKESLNASLGTNSPTFFNAGGLGYGQHTTNLDLSKELEVGFEQPINLATGFEWRYESFKITAGDEASYIHGGIPVLDGENAGQITMAGAQGFPGFRKANELQEDRHNLASYIDIDGQFYDRWSLGLAGRYEYYSDFGSSLTGKISLAYQVIDDILLRGSVGTGFRAPSLQQSYFNSTSSINIDNNLLSTSTLSVESPVANALGARPLQAEQSQHFTTGFVYQPLVNLSFSADYFYTKINDRIIFSRNIGSSTSAEVADILATENLSVVRFFSNAMDTETQGVDLRANYKLDFQNQGQLKLTGLYHYNKTKIIGQIRSPSVLGNANDDILFSETDRQRLELGQPNESLILIADYNNKAFNSVFKLIKAGAFSEQQQRLSSQWLVDVDIAYRLPKYVTIAVGVHNLFDSEPERNNTDGAFLQSSPYGYNGGFYYLRLVADF